MKSRRKINFTAFFVFITAIIVIIFTALQTYIPFLPKTKIQKPKQQQAQFCQRLVFENKSYSICQFDPKIDKIALFLYDKDNKPYNYFRNVEKELNEMGEKLAFAVNAGMYHDDYSAVGLYIENGKELQKISTKDGYGNFHMKPNGVFYIKDHKAAILETESYIRKNPKPDLATQSGPMLVIDNEIHPRFYKDSPYLEYRNGVGVRKDGTVIFVNSDKKVNFDEFARLFRDTLKTPNALFLDGSISSLYAPELTRYDWFYPLGPILAVVVNQ